MACGTLQLERHTGCGYLLDTYGPWCGVVWDGGVSSGTVGVQLWHFGLLGSAYQRCAEGLLLLHCWPKTGITSCTMSCGCTSYPGLGPARNAGALWQGPAAAVPSCWRVAADGTDWLRIFRYLVPLDLAAVVDAHDGLVAICLKAARGRVGGMDTGAYLGVTVWARLGAWALQRLGAQRTAVTQLAVRWPV